MNGLRPTSAPLVRAGSGVAVAPSFYGYRFSTPLAAKLRRTR